MPVHQELGAILLAAKRPADAEQAFRTDLDHFPDNGWSLFGLAESLRAQRKTAAADEALAAYRKAWEGTEPPFVLQASR